jgi:hypothetical protein
MDKTMLKFQYLTLATLLISTMAQPSHAVDINVAASAEFRLAITLVATPIDFTTGTNEIDYTGTPTALDIIEMGTNGAINYTTPVFSGAATGTPGTVTITGSSGQGVDITCTPTATIGDGTNTLVVSQLQISVNGTDGFGLADDNCAGLGTSPLSHTLVVGADVINIGGRIVGNSGTVAEGPYSTATGGTPAQVRVTYQ